MACHENNYGMHGPRVLLQPRYQNNVQPTLQFNTIIFVSLLQIIDGDVQDIKISHLFTFYMYLCD